MKNWNRTPESISERLRDEEQIHYVNDNHTLMYNPGTKETGLILDVFIVDPHEGLPEERYDGQREDRYVEYTVAHQLRKDWSVDLDDEGWIWQDNMEKK